MQHLTLFDQPIQESQRATQAKWRARAAAVASLQSAFDGLREACMDSEFVGKCVAEQTNVIKGTGFEDDPNEDNIIQAEEGDEASGEVSGSMNSILPEGWIESELNTLKPSEYITKLLAEVAKEVYPTLQQLCFLAVLVNLLDIIKAEEEHQIEWRLRTQKVLMLLGQGGWG